MALGDFKYESRMWHVRHKSDLQSTRRAKHLVDNQSQPHKSALPFLFSIGRRESALSNATERVSDCSDVDVSSTKKLHVVVVLSDDI